MSHGFTAASGTGNTFLRPRLVHLVSCQSSSTATNWNCWVSAAVCSANSRNSTVTENEIAYELCLIRLQCGPHTQWEIDHRIDVAIDIDLGNKIKSCRRRIQIDRRDRCNFEIIFLTGTGGHILGAGWKGEVGLFTLNDHGKFWPSMSISAYMPELGTKLLITLREFGCGKRYRLFSACLFTILWAVMN